MKKITYSLNYRKPKEEYTENCELTVCVRYYQKLDNGKHKVVKKVLVLNANSKTGTLIGIKHKIDTLSNLLILTI